MNTEGPGTYNADSSGDEKPEPGGLPPLSSELQLVRILDRTLKSRYPEGVSLLQTLEGGLVLALHDEIHQPFSPHACARSSELTGYLWQVGRVPSLEPGGGITIRSSAGQEKFVIGRKFFSETEDEYRLIHSLIAQALGK